MKVSEVKLTNFRNYEKVEVKTGADLVLILGDNAAGKTNFLESVYYLSRLKSFRAPDQFLVRTGSDFFTIQGQIPEKILEATVQIYPVTRRQFKANNQKIKRNFWQAFKTVLFVPNDLNLFTLGPVLRRKFMDEVLSQKTTEYEIALVSLEHVLSQKSALLEQLNQGMGDRAELDFWNEQLAESSILVYQHRRDMAEFMNQNFAVTHERLAGFPATVMYVYKSHLLGLDKAGLLGKLSQYQEAEIRSMKNLIGPHRDDFILEKEGIENIYNSSRGELRSQILTLKLLQAEFLTEANDKPVILLDDVFSELDETRRSKLLESLTGHQIFITTTEEHHLPALKQEALILRVEKNMINT